MDRVQRRDFLIATGALLAAPFAAEAQQPLNAPLVGFLNSASPVTYRFNADAFREGLAQAGFVEGRNVRIEERWANADYNALPALADELVARVGARRPRRERDRSDRLHHRRRSRTLWTRGELQQAWRQCHGHCVRTEPTWRQARPVAASPDAQLSARGVVDEPGQS